MVKHRRQISTRLRAKLHVECSHKCSIPNCPVQVGLQIHHINAKPDDNRKKNLLTLCPNHHDMATRGIITKMECSMYKDNLKKTTPKSGEEILKMINDCTRKAVREEIQKAMSNWSQTKDGEQVK